MLQRQKLVCSHFYIPKSRSIDLLMQKPNHHRITTTTRLPQSSDYHNHQNFRTSRLPQLPEKHSHNLTPLRSHSNKPHSLRRFLDRNFTYFLGGFTSDRLGHVDLIGIVPVHPVVLSLPLLDTYIIFYPHDTKIWSGVLQVG